MIKLFSAFSGIGAFEKALSNLNIDYELVSFSEIDRYAIESYSLLHNIDKSKNFGNISEIDKSLLPDFDLFTWGFPCQDFSIIGKRAGFNGDKSILFFQGLEVLKAKRPKISIAENVSALLHEKHKNELKIIVDSFRELGYKTQILLLDAKNCGIPQSRKRVFFISTLENIFINIKPCELLFEAKDILESNVEDIYYLSEKQINYFNKKKSFSNAFKPCIKDDFIIAKCITTRRDDITCNFIINNKGIRSLTPLECWRLMGWKDDDFKKVKHISNRQLYKQTGNSIVIQVLEKILKKLYLEG